MASPEHTEKKLRVLLIPFFATSHIGPFTDFAVRLAAASPDAVEPTVAVTPANARVVRSALERHGSTASSGAVVKIDTYPFPDVDGLPRGVENLFAAGDDGWRIDAAAMNEALTRPAQEALIRELSPDAIITDVHFFWNSAIAAELGVPCVTFSVISSFSSFAMVYLRGALNNGDPDWQEASLLGFPGPEIRIPRTELPEFLRNPQMAAVFNPCSAAMGRCFGLAVNTFFDLEQPYCEMYQRSGHVKRCYFVGPLSLPSQPSVASGAGAGSCIDWLDTKPSRSVVYVSFGTVANVSNAQLHELALGLEASGKAFLWVVRAEEWSPPAGWEERVGDRGLVVTDWAPQTAILAHPAVAAFVTQCGWNSVQETVAAGVPMLTWPVVFEQFITERLATEVLRIGERLWPEGAGVRSTRYDEKEVVPAEAVAHAVAKFMEPGGAAEVARSRVKELAAKAHAAVAEGGSSHRELRHLIDDLMEARTAAGAARSM